MVAKKKSTTAKKSVAKSSRKASTSRRKPAVKKPANFHPNEALLAIAVGAALILVSLALVTGV